MKFINRTLELTTLENKWNDKKSQFIIIYGKRRIGKTELIKNFIKNKPAIYFLSDKRSSHDQLKELGRLFGEHFHDSLLSKQGFSEWLDVFRYLNEKVKERFIFAIDEYPYLVESDKTISSVFQKGWDEYLKNKNIFLILSGSSISMMESETLLYKSPLYGRRTGQILVQQMPFHESRKFFPELDFEKGFSTRKAVSWIKEIKSKRIRNLVEQKFSKITDFCLKPHK